MRKNSAAWRCTAGLGTVSRGDDVKICCTFAIVAESIIVQLKLYRGITILGEWREKTELKKQGDG